MVSDCGPMVMGCGSDSPMVVVLVLGPQCGVFNNLDFFSLLLFMVASGYCWWLVAGGGNDGWMWYELGSKYLRIKYLESLLFCIGKPRLKHI